MDSECVSCAHSFKTGRKNNETDLFFKWVSEETLCTEQPCIFCMWEYDLCDIFNAMKKNPIEQ